MPDNTGPFWPASWAIGWVSWEYVDMEGWPKEGAIEVSLLYPRAVAPDDHTAVVGGRMTVQLVDGKPFHPLAQINSAGAWCLPVPVTADADVEPIPNKLVITERFKNGGGAILYVDVTAANTLENPAWVTDDLTAVVLQPGVTLNYIWSVEHEADGAPAAATVGQWVFFEDTLNIYRIGA